MSPAEQDVFLLGQNMSPLGKDVSSRTGGDPSRARCVPGGAGYVPSRTGHVPSVPSCVPSMAGCVPSRTDYLPLSQGQPQSGVTQHEVTGRSRAARTQSIAGRRRQHTDGNLFLTIHGDVN